MSYFYCILNQSKIYIIMIKGTIYLKNFIALFLLVLLFTGCGSTGTTTTQNSPDITVGDQTLNNSTTKVRVFVSATTIKPGEVVELATDIIDDIIEYQWWDQNGELLSSTATTNWTAPKQAGEYSLTLTRINDKQVQTHSTVTMTVTAEDVVEPVIATRDSTFNAIKALISNANQGLITDATYICVGDSTRAESRHEGQYLFYEMSSKLRQYNLSSHLLARAGHEAKQFLNETASPTWRETVDLIPGDGNHCIVDISLGINDYWNYGGTSNIQSDIKNAILKIKALKPLTHFVLSMPNRAYNDDTMTQDLKNIYISLSYELNIPLNNIVDDLMPTQYETPYSWYRDDGFNVHLSREGQSVIAEYILGNMLP